MRYFIILLGLLFACTTPPIKITPVLPFGPDNYTTSASTWGGSPGRVRMRVIEEASAFCGLRGERSLPIEINLVTVPNPVTHSVTIVFRCFDPADMGTDV